MYGNADFLSGLGAEPVRGQKRLDQSPTSEIIHQDPFHEASKTTSFGSFLKRYTKELMVTLSVAALVGTAMVNAVFLQTSKHPAPLFVKQDKPEITQKSTAAVPKPRAVVLAQEEAASIATPKQGRESVADPIVKEVQRHLVARGYYNSTVDGVMGARTKAAIGVYQRAFDIPVTNEASRALLEHIRLSIPDKEYHAKARERVSKTKAQAELRGSHSAGSEPSKDLIITDPEHIKQVQKALKRLGYNLVADGVAGRNTNHAIVEFKKQQGLLPDKDITLALVNELIKLKKL